MKTAKACIVTVTLIVFFLPFCQSQNIQYRSKIRPIVKAKLDSLYPHSKNVTLDQSSIHDTTQILRFNCNCDETNDTGYIVLVFDTNGNLLNKVVYYYGSFALDRLPDTIQNYIKKNESPTVKFDKKDMIKYYNNKGEISYGIIMNNSYILKFKNTGEFISKEAIPQTRTD